MKFVTKIAKVGTKLATKVKINEPKICLVFGIGGIVIGTVLACRSSIKLPDVIDDTKNELDNLRKEHTTEYTHPDTDEVLEVKENPITKKELAEIYVRCAGRIIKLYVVPTAITGLSIYALVRGHNIMVRRNLELAAAYTTLEKGFDKYRERVVNDVGADKDREYYTGSKKPKDKDVTDEKGEVMNVKETNKNSEVPESPHCIVLNKYSPGAYANVENTLFAIKAKEKQLLNKLSSNGHLFAMELYDVFNTPRPNGSSIVGWVLDEGDRAEDVFHIDTEISYDDEGNPIYYIMFDPQGLIWNKI